jgi:hypothetical protein
VVADAEKFKAQDEELRKKGKAKNAFERHCFGVRNSMNEEKLGGTQIR